MKSIRNSVRWTIAFLFAGLVYVACTLDDPATPSALKQDAVLYWNEKMETVLHVQTFTVNNQVMGMTPPAQSRFFAMMTIAVHDALNAITERYEPFALRIPSVPAADPEAAIASAVYQVIRLLGLEGAFPLEEWYHESLQRIPDDEAKEKGISIGLQAAEAIVAARADDQIEIANQQLPGPDGTLPGEYRSTLWFSSSPNAPKIKALSQWGKVMPPFVIERNDQFRPAPPYTVQSASYEADYAEIKALGGAGSPQRTKEQTEITKFWIERPATSWNRFARNILAHKDIDAWEAARMFALMNTAMADEVTAGFDAKYHYFFWRAETAIRLKDDSNPNTEQDTTWLPSYIESPNADPARHVYVPMIPEYPSVHAGFGGAASEILLLVLGDDKIAVAQTSLNLPATTRHYSSIRQAARDNTVARLYAGHYFRTSLDVGEEQGRQVAKYVFEHAFGKK